jgi:septum formation protein
MDTLILASKSPRRREILEQLGIPFTLCAVEIDEEAHFRKSVRSSVMNVARKKAEAAAVQYANGLVLGVDTVVSFKGRVLGKPENAETAARFLHMLSGNEHEVLSGITVYNTATGCARSDCSVSAVQFASMSGRDIDRYIALGEWADKAGAYAIQGRAALYVRSITGSYYNIVGLPVEKLYTLLKGFTYFRSNGNFLPVRR